MSPNGTVYDVLPFGFTFEVIHSAKIFFFSTCYLPDIGIIILVYRIPAQESFSSIETITIACEVVFNGTHILRMWKLRLVKDRTCPRPRGCCVEVGIRVKSFDSKAFFHFLLVKHVELLARVVFPFT